MKSRHLNYTKVIRHYQHKILTV